MQLNLSHNRLCGVWLKYGSFGDQMGTYTAKGILAIAKALKVTPSLTELSISGNSIGDDGKYAIGAAVGSSMQRLVCDQLDLRADATELKLTFEGLGPGDAALIAGGLRAFMASVTELNLFDNSIKHVTLGI